MRVAIRILPFLILILAACGDDGTPTDGALVDTSTPPTDSGGGADTGARVDSGPDDGGGSDTGTPTTDSGTTPADCDFRTVDGIAVIEAESLPLTEEWEVATEFAGFIGDGYIRWPGASHNNDPTHGVMSIAVCVESAGRYQLQWRNRIGMGTNATEHNDSWVKFPDATTYFGARPDGDGESRRYPNPICGTDGFLAGIEAMAGVTVAECVRGSSRDGWFKVYSSGATDWRWSTHTSDSDAHDVVFEVDSPGAYTFTMAARGDFHLIDRIHIHEATIADDDARNEALPETAVD